MKVKARTPIDLKSGQTFWEARTPRMLRTSRQPARDFYDIVIVGAGISGALAADALAGLGGHMLIVDGRTPGAGSTSASTALIQWEIDEPLGALSGKVGRKRAVASYQAARRAVATLSRKISSERLACDFRARKSLLIAGDAMGGKALEREAALRRRWHLPSEFVDRQTLARRFGFDRAGAILSSGNCELDPRKLTNQLLRNARRRGAELVSCARIVGIYGTQRGAFVELEDGTVIAARKVIAATGYEALPHVPKDAYKLISTWALATQPVPAAALWHQAALVWEASDPYLYFRTTADQRIIVGGEDAEYVDADRRDAQITKKSETILRKLAMLLPNVPLQAAYAWAGTFATSDTGLPVIGEAATLPSVFVILGAGGNGITFSVIAAEMAAAWLSGRRHPLTDVFAPA
jgi:glycine/D-amino acid oxidase-like deaminating enzyme